MLKKCFVLLFLMAQCTIKAADTGYTSSEDDSSSDGGFKTYEFNGFQKAKHNWVNVGLWKKVKPETQATTLPPFPDQIISVPVEIDSTFADVKQYTEKCIHRNIDLCGVQNWRGIIFHAPLNNKVKNHEWIIYNQSNNYNTIVAIFPPIPALQQKLHLREMTGKKIHQ